MHFDVYKLLDAEKIYHSMNGTTKSMLLVRIHEESNFVLHRELAVVMTIELRHIRGIDQSSLHWAIKIE